MSQTQLSAPPTEMESRKEEVIPRLKTPEEALEDEGFFPEAEVHHTEEEVAERLFTVEVPEEVKSVWGWASSSFSGTSLSAIAEKAKKAAEEVAENVKASAEELAEKAEEIAENVKTQADAVVQNAKTQSREVQKAVEEKTAKQSGYSYPWEPKTRFSTEIRERILRLPEENNTFLVPPPVEVNFTFDFETNADAAIKMLEADPALEKKRFELVPRQLDENTFWKNYFYRVELIKRSYGADEELAQNVESVKASEETETQEDIANHEEEVDAKLLDDDDSLEFEDSNLPYESKKGQKESKRELSGAAELSWEEELEAEVDSENFDMLNDDELVDDGDDSDLEERIKAELSLS